ncbi:MAG: zinc-ribbon domain-containing protein [Vulcanimicrobiaceae bacterium]
MSDRILTCSDCGRNFTFTSGEQRFYELKGFTNVPTRCEPCRSARKALRAKHVQSGARGAPNLPQTVAAACANCGAATQVLVSLRARPAYCRDCFASRPTYR